MKDGAHHKLTRRERQIMDAVFQRGKATVSDVLEEMPDPPSYSAVRAMIGRLEAKGYLTHSESGGRYVYEATLPKESAQASALERLVRTFFDDSPSIMLAALLDLKGENLTDEELATLADLIESARRKGR